MAPKIFKTPYSQYTSHLKDIQKDINRDEKARRKRAMLHVARKMRKNLSEKSPSKKGQFPGFITKSLRKGIGFKSDVKARGERMSLVGSRSGKSHLLEFGYGPGKEDNKRPFFRRTFSEEAKQVEKIFRDPWL